MTQITHTLNANTRDLVGKKAKKLRLSGNIIGTVYGQKQESATISVGFTDFTKTYKEVGTTGVISLVIDKKAEPVMIHHVEKHPVDGSILNVEFYRVNLKEKLKAHVPIVYIDEAPAAKEGLGVVVTLMNDVEVMAKPTDIPEHFTVSLAPLTALDATITVQQLSLPVGVELVSDGSQEIVRIGELAKPVEEAAPKEAEGENRQSGAESAAETAATSEE